MKKAMKKIASILLVAVLLSVASIPAYAAEMEEIEPQEIQEQYIEITPYWTNIASIKPYINVSSGTASYTASVSVYSFVSSYKVTATIQKQNLWWWDDVTSSSKTYSTSNSNLSGTHSVGSGTFRLKVSVEVNGETVTVYS